MKGYIQTQEALVKVSQMKASTDQMKGKTLEEISAIVQNINGMLKERKNRLAPQIKELRNVRQKYQELDRVYSEKKKQYENTAAGLESDRLKLENSADLSQTEALREESRFHYMNCLVTISGSRLYQIEREQNFLDGNSKERLHRDCKVENLLFFNTKIAKTCFFEVL